MKLVFAEQAWEDYQHWQQTNKQIVRRIHELIKDTTRDLFTGLGKPEPLRFALAGDGSCRINAEHRMVYKVEGSHLLLAQLRYHC